MSLSAYKGESLLHIFEEPITFPLEFGDADSRHFGIALSVARRSRELPANEEIIRFSATVDCRWYVYDPFNRDKYFSSVFPQLIQQATESNQPIHFNLANIEPYHDTTLRELRYVVHNTTALDSTCFYQWRDNRYVTVDINTCRSTIAALLESLD